MSLLSGAPAAQRRVSSYNLANALLALAVVDYNDSGIVGSAPVTAWVNSGVGGSEWDLDTVAGTAANLVRTTMNGIDVVQSVGSVAIHVSVIPTLIEDPCVVFLVGNFTNASPGGASPQYLMRMSDKSGNQGVAFNALAAAPNNFAFAAAPTLEFPASYDTDVHVWTQEGRGNAENSLYTISGVGSQGQTEAVPPAIGGSGSFPVLFALTPGPTFPIPAIIARILVFDFELTPFQIAAIQKFLAETYIA